MEVLWLRYEMVGPIGEAEEGQTVTLPWVLRTQDFVQAVQHPRDLLGGGLADLAAEALRGQSSYLADFGPGTPGPKSAPMTSQVSGKPTRGSWLVSAAVITVPERALNTSSLRIRTERRPDCP